MRGGGGTKEGPAVSFRVFSNLYSVKGQCARSSDIIGGDRFAVDLDDDTSQLLLVTTVQLRCDSELEISAGGP